MISPTERISAQIESEGHSVYPWVVAIVLALLYTLSFLDRQLISILAEPIRHDLGLSDTQLGLLSGFMFALFYTAFGIPVAWLADRGHRVRVIAAACVLWSLFSAACGFARNFVELALARIGVGIGEAGGSPPSYSIIADYFPANRRATALAIYSLGVPLGTTLGAALAGWLAIQYGWRMAFVMIGLPGIVVAAVILAVVREPQRGRFDADKPKPAKLHEAIGTFVRSPVLVLTAVSSGCSAFVGYAMLAWAPAFLMRTKGMGLADIATYYSLVSGIASAAGMLSSGVLVDRIGKRYPQAYALLPAVIFLLALPFYLGAMWAPRWPLALACIAVPFAFYIVYLAPALALVQNHAPPAQRSTASALLLLVLNIVGLGLGPLYVGMVSDWATPKYGGAALQVGMLALAPFFIVATAAHLVTARVLRAQPAA